MTSIFYKIKSFLFTKKILFANQTKILFLHKFINMKFFYLGFLSLIFLFSCNKKNETKYTIILPSDYKKNVQNWLLNFDTTLNVINIYNIPNDSLDFILKNADGIVLTGGADIQPKIYGQDSLKKYCGKFNPRRDSLDSILLNYAINHKLPLLGICRGLQFINVGLGGTLIPDIPTFVGDSIHRNNGAVYHKVKILPNTFTATICRVDTGTVYSNHHQAINNIAKSLRISAIATDSVIEAVEWKDTTGKNFLLAVQWHPEAMDYRKPLSANIAKAFILAVKSKK